MEGHSAGSYHGDAKEQAEPAQEVTPRRQDQGTHRFLRCGTNGKSSLAVLKQGRCEDASASGILHPATRDQSMN